MAKTSGTPLGIDIGGSGVKGAPVDLHKGEFAAKRLRIDTPKPATPDAVAEVVDQIVDHFADVTEDAPIGVTVPGIVIRGKVLSAANIDPSWVDTDAADLIREHTGRHVTVLNDADAAGLGELYYGAAKGADGVVLLITLGTGIGSALIHRGVLVPNTELGHIEYEGESVEKFAAASVKENQDLTYPQYAERLQVFLDMIDRLFSPDLVVIGGGISKDYEQFLPLIKTRAKVVPAKLKNKAGIIGAARAAVDIAQAAEKGRPL